jgi:hypothetical protein
VKKSLLVIALFVLGCSAAYGQTFTFGFENYDGSVLYCNYETFTLTNAAYLAYGTDNLTAACGGVVDAVLVGSKSATPLAAGLGQTGLAYGMADNLYDAIYQFDTNFQWYVISKTKPSVGRHPKQGWIGFAGYAGYILGSNQGLLTLSIPSPTRPSSGHTSIGNAKMATLKTTLKSIKK